MWIEILIIALVTIVSWYILGIPKNIHTDKPSKNALGHIYHWFGQMLGPKWPFVLVFISVLLIIILLLSENINITISKNSAKLVAVFTITLAILLTYNWRIKFIKSQRGTNEYYIELGIIIILLIINAYLINGS